MWYYTSDLAMLHACALLHIGIREYTKEKTNTTGRTVVYLY
jgi:hypothetical protein